MKLFNVLNLVVLTVSLILAGCTTTPLVVDDKYRFTEFETVDSITNYRVSGWQSIDSQSLIVETSPSTYYLLVLKNKVRDLNFSEGIALSSTGTKIQANFDCVQVRSTRCSASQAAAIDTIYLLKSRESVKYVKDKIRNS